MEEEKEDIYKVIFYLRYSIKTDQTTIEKDIKKLHLIREKLNIPPEYFNKNFLLENGVSGRNGISSKLKDKILNGKNIIATTAVERLCRNTNNINIIIDM